MDLQLQGKRAIVTGGSKGIGRSIVSGFLDEGAQVATCARTPQPLQEAIEGWEGQFGSGRVFGDPVDVADADFEEWVASAAGRLGGLDALILNASIQPSGEDDATWELTMAADLLQVARAVRAARAALAASGGCVVLISSTTALSTATPAMQHAYGSIKAAVLSYGGKLAATLGPEGIRVNTVIPGPIEFPGGTWAGMRQGMPQVVEGVERLSALGRLGAPEEVAAAVLFLASPAAGYITGASLRVDGGTTKSVDF